MGRINYVTGERDVVINKMKDELRRIARKYDVNCTFEMTKYMLRVDFEKYGYGHINTMILTDEFDPDNMIKCLTNVENDLVRILRERNIPIPKHNDNYDAYRYIAPAGMEMKLNRLREFLHHISKKYGVFFSIPRVDGDDIVIRFTKYAHGLICTMEIDDEELNDFITLTMRIENDLVKILRDRNIPYPEKTSYKENVHIVPARGFDRSASHLSDGFRGGKVPPIDAGMVEYCKHDVAVTTNHFNRFRWNPFSIKNVIFNEPATIVFWADGTKTVVKAQDGEEFDPEKGLAMAISKKALGNQGNYFETFKEWIDYEKEEENPAVHSLRTLADRLAKVEKLLQGETL